MLGALQSEFEVEAVAPAAVPAPADAGARLADVRALTMDLCQGLRPEDCESRGLPDASPLKWHLAHTTWFLETFALADVPDYRPLYPELVRLFDSYDHRLGAAYPRGQRGLLMHPSLEQVCAWRAHVDAAALRLLRDAPDAAFRDRVELALQHEQQHQELLLADIKQVLRARPGKPAYRAAPLPPQPAALPARWIERPGVLSEVGHDGEGFGFDNEFPRHRVWLDTYAIASRAVTNAEYLAFIQDGGYHEPRLWLADGWDCARARGWERPSYWSADCDRHYTLRGELPLSPDEPVCHVSYYEADAYARWAKARLPREAEWEATAASWPVAGNFLESGALHPRASEPLQPAFHGNVWEWTASAYVPYPRYRPGPGALGEYGPRAMCNQQVLRGGSCASSAGHLRPSYRKFLPPHARWQFSGLRLAKDLG